MNKICLATAPLIMLIKIKVWIPKKYLFPQIFDYFYIATIATKSVFAQTEHTLYTCTQA